MKDITIRISRQRQRCELITLTTCFVLAFLTNVYAIVTYNAPWTELITSIFFVICMTITLYIAWTFARIIVWALRKKKTTTDKTIEI